MSECKVSGGGPDISFARLPQIDPAEIIAHMSDPRVTAHLPLATEPWDAAYCANFIAVKEEAWARDGLGHGAFLVDRVYAGWGGFQKVDEDWDFGLVLRREFFGLGPRIIRAALDFARSDPRIDHATFLLAPSRPHLRGLERLGAVPVGPVKYANQKFVKYRLEFGGAGSPFENA
ncbi:GNAT family N-acetyltransferase [Amaricoccus macauensis]|uniref:GNAT family N-acetyltransferase n=1 Tax=Amaricoccus macauensis TaxID=57001 RepID=UPI003C7D2AFC